MSTKKAQGRVSCLVPLTLSGFQAPSLIASSPRTYFASSVTAADSIFTFAASDEPAASEFNDVAS